MADASLHALANAFGDAHAATVALAAAGGPTVAQIQAAVAAAMVPLQTQVLALSQSVADVQATVGRIEQRLDRLEVRMGRVEVLSARAWNASCGYGVVRKYVAVPNAAGELPPANLQPVTSLESLRQLSMPQLARWCDFFGQAPPASKVERRMLLAAHLGLAWEGGALEAA